MANGRIPSPSEILSPIVGVENALINVARAPFQQIGLPAPPSITGPVGLVQRFASQLPTPRLP